MRKFSDFVIAQHTNYVLQGDLMDGLVNFATYITLDTWKYVRLDNFYDLWC